MFLKYANAGLALSEDGIAIDLPTDSKLYIATRAVSAIINANGDAYPDEELKKSYKTLEGKPVYKEHVYTRDYGIVKKSVYNSKTDPPGIDILALIEDPQTIKEIQNKEWKSVSIGALVAEAECSVCGNIAESESDLCEHVLFYKGTTITINNKPVLVYEINRGIEFFEVSLVASPADGTALIY